MPDPVFYVGDLVRFHPLLLNHNTQITYRVRETRIKSQPEEVSLVRLIGHLEWVHAGHLVLVQRATPDDRFAAWLDLMRIRSTNPSQRAHFDARERLQDLASDQAEALADMRRLTRELDVALNGEEGAAPQASLCDIVAQVRTEGPSFKPQDPINDVCRWALHGYRQSLVDAWRGVSNASLQACIEAGVSKDAALAFRIGYAAGQKDMPMPETTSHTPDTFLRETARCQCGPEEPCRECGGSKVVYEHEEAGGCPVSYSHPCGTCCGPEEPLVVNETALDATQPQLSRTDATQDGTARDGEERRMKERRLVTEAAIQRRFEKSRLGFDGNIRLAVAKKILQLGSGHHIGAGVLSSLTDLKLVRSWHTTYWNTNTAPTVAALLWAAHVMAGTCRRKAERRSA